MSATIAGIGKSYGTVNALVSVDLKVRDGEFVAILGPSGCGKTTLLRIVGGFETPSRGEIFIDDTLVGSPQRAVPTEKRDLGMVFQSFALWPHLTVADHIAFPLNYRRSSMTKQQRDARIQEVLDLTGLASMADRMPHQLSGGQRQRVALARAIAPEPALLLMDEPLSALDAALREDMRREIQNLHNQTEASVMYVTHDQGEALAMADRIVVMRDGLIEQVGTPWDIYYQPETSFVAGFVSKSNLIPGRWDGDAFVPDIAGGAAVWRGVHVTEALRRDGVCAVRPEMLTVRSIGEHEAPGPDEIAGVVENSLFQGREVHYSVRVGDSSWSVYGRAMVQVGDRVAVGITVGAEQSLGASRFGAEDETRGIAVGRD